MALEDNNAQRAAEESDKALAISQESLGGLAVRSVLDWMKLPEPTPQSATPWMERALKINPHYGEGYALAAHIFIINRRYEEGIAFYQKALELNPELWEARSDLGVNLMRLGRDDEARRHLELCYQNGFKNPATVNSLRLLDSYKNFVVFKTPRTIIKLHKREADLLRPYMEH
jgi:tetratricopeptide (TPR) repeat protein